MKAFEQAVSYYQQISNPESQEYLEARLKSGRLLMYQLGQAAEAEQEFRRVLQAAPHHPEASLELALLLGILARQREAVPLILNVFRQGKMHLDLLTLLATSQGRLSMPKLFERYRQQTPQDPGVLLAEAWEARNSPVQVDSERAFHILQQAVRQHPRALFLRHAYAQALWDRQQMAELLTELRFCFDAGDVPAEIWVLRGQLAEQDGDNPGAARCYFEAFRLAPDDSKAVFKLAEAALRLNRDDSANWLRGHLEQLRNVKQLGDILLGSEHSSTGPLRDYATALAGVGRLWEAWGWCQIALQLNPRETWAWEFSKDLADKWQDCPLKKVCLDLSRIPVDFSKEPLPSWRSVPMEISVSKPLPNITFQDQAPEAGLRFRYFNSPHEKKLGQRMFEFPGGGCGVVDYDRDGWPDLYLTQGCRWPLDQTSTAHLDELFRNLEGKSFQKITNQAGLMENGFSGGVAVGDWNNDGFPDVYVANIGPNRLYVNNGDGTFADVTEAAGTGDPRWSTSCVIADLNKDALPDIYSVNYLQSEDVFQRICRHDDGRPRMCMPFQFPGAQDQVFLNQGNGLFESATQSSGMTVPDGKGLGVVVAELSGGDRHLDVFVANDTVANSLFVPQTQLAPPAFRFQEKGLLHGVAVNGAGKAEGCMGIAVGDVDGDGRQDLFVTNFHQESNTLYLQTGEGMFSDETQAAGLATGSLNQLGFGTQFLDADLDGWLDVVITNGHIDDLRPYGRPYQMPTQFFYNRGKGRFAELEPNRLGSFFGENALGRGLAAWDWNRDGKEDFVVSFLDRPAALVTNTTPAAGNSLVLRFAGVPSSRDAIGAAVWAKVGDRVLMRQLTAGSGYQASNQRHIVLGLGPARQVDQLKLRWPSGTEQVYHNLRANQELLLIESNPFPIPLPSP